MASSPEDPLVEQLKRVQSDLGFRRTTRRRVVAIAAAVVCDLIVSVLSVAAFVGVRHQQEQSADDRTAARRGACIQFNTNQKNTRDAIVFGLVETFRPLTQPNRTADLDAFAKSLRANVDRQLPYRDCSEAGIQKFLEDPPPDPATTPGG